MDKVCWQLSKEEWDFSSCSNLELEECWHYEYQRESPLARQIILDWRTACRASTFDELLRFVQSMLGPPVRGRLYALCPEWPNFPYLSIPRAERERRFRQLFQDLREAPAAELEPTAALPGDLPLEVLNVILAMWGRDLTREDVTFRINWRMPDKAIMLRFKAWLKVHRRIRASMNVSKRILRADMKALGAFRILRANQDGSRRPEIFSEQSEWIKARKRAQKNIQNTDSWWRRPISA